MRWHVLLDNVDRKSRVWCDATVKLEQELDADSGQERLRAASDGGDRRVASDEYVKAGRSGRVGRRSRSSSCRTSCVICAGPGSSMRNAGTRAATGWPGPRQAITRLPTVLDAVGSPLTEPLRPDQARCGTRSRRARERTPRFDRRSRTCVGPERRRPECAACGSRPRRTTRCGRPSSSPRPSRRRARQGRAPRAEPGDPAELPREHPDRAASGRHRPDPAGRRGRLPARPARPRGHRRRRAARRRGSARRDPGRSSRKTWSTAARRSTCPSCGSRSGRASGPCSRR